MIDRVTILKRDRRVRSADGRCRLLVRVHVGRSTADGVGQLHDHGMTVTCDGTSPNPFTSTIGTGPRTASGTTAGLRTNV